MYVSYEILFMCCILNLRAATIGKKYEQSNYMRTKKSFLAHFEAEELIEENI